MNGLGSSTVRKKRNFKGLQLAPEPPPPSPSPPPVASTSSDAPPAVPPKQPRRPPAMDLSKSARPPPPAVEPRGAYHNKLSEQLASLELGVEFKLDLRGEDLETLDELGSGNGGTVTLVRHLPTKKIMAKKVVLIEAKPAVRRQILRELQIMHDCSSEHIISFYGAFLNDPHICMCMEYMDKGSLDSISRKHGPIDIDVCGKISVAVLEGLTYLYDVHRIIHRDVKPSNILVNSQGQIKICDFGVSGELINSIADTFVGTSTYMSPERIQGAQYTVKSDVWSLGISLIELALGRFPFSSDDDKSASEGEGPPPFSAGAGGAGPFSSESDTFDLNSTLSPSNTRPPTASSISSSSKAAAADKQKAKRKSVSAARNRQPMMSILDLLQHIVNEPAPRLPEGKFAKEPEEFIDLCLLKDPEARPSPKQLLNHPWTVSSKAKNVDLVAWTASV